MSVLKSTTTQLRERLDELQDEIEDKEEQVARAQQQCNEATAQNSALLSDLDRIHRQTVGCDELSYTIIIMFQL